MANTLPVSCFPCRASTLKDGDGCSEMKQATCKYREQKTILPTKVKRMRLTWTGVL